MTCEAKYCVTCGAEIENRGNARYCAIHKPIVMGKARIEQREVPRVMADVNDNIVTMREGMIAKSPLSKEDLARIEHVALVTLSHPAKVLRYLVRRGLSDLEKNHYQLSL